MLPRLPRKCHGKFTSVKKRRPKNFSNSLMCLYLHGQSVLFCRSRHKDHVDEKHQVPSNPTLLVVIADKDTYGNVDLSYASGLERADSTKIQGRADHDPARCFFMVDIPMFI